MNGVFTYYNEERGYGFIKDHNGENYFAHITEIKGDDLPYVGARARFSASKNAKGNIAKDILVDSFESSIYERKPKIITFGDVRVIISNIKNYGLSQAEMTYQKVYVKKEKETVFSFLQEIYEDIWEGELMPLGEGEIVKWQFGALNGFWYNTLTGKRMRRLIHGKKGIYEDGNSIFDPKADIKSFEEQYLYVTTYQGDNFKFWEKESDFNIENKLNELDTYFYNYKLKLPT